MILLYVSVSKGQSIFHLSCGLWLGKTEQIAGKTERSFILGRGGLAERLCQLQNRERSAISFWRHQCISDAKIPSGKKHYTYSTYCVTVYTYVCVCMARTGVQMEFMFFVGFARRGFDALLIVFWATTPFQLNMVSGCLSVTGVELVLNSLHLDFSQLLNFQPGEMVFPADCRTIQGLIYRVYRVVFCSWCYFITTFSSFLVIFFFDLKSAVFTGKCWNWEWWQIWTNRTQPWNKCEAKLTTVGTSLKRKLRELCKLVVSDWWHHLSVVFLERERIRSV